MRRPSACAFWTGLSPASNCKAALTILNAERTMPNQLKSKNVPRATIMRLATYVQVLETFARDGVEIISSQPLAAACGVNGSQVRKDLAYFGEFGVRGVGYNVKSLISSITGVLDVDREWRMALVGVGNLGRAILNHGDFRARRFNIVEIFDCDPFKIGETMHGLEVRCTDTLKDVAAVKNIEIAIIATPPERAQRAAAHIVDAGITSILNFAPARISVPRNVQVEYVDFFRHLYILAFGEGHSTRPFPQPDEIAKSVCAEYDE